jgi:Tfp pilus assembly protein PilV
MGAGHSTGPKLDLANATLSVGDAQKQLAAQVATAQTNTWGYAKTGFYFLGALLLLGGIGAGLYYLYTYLTIQKLESTQEATLVIDSATLMDPMYVNSDITAQVNAQVKGDSLYLEKGVAPFIDTSTLTCITFPTVGATGATGATGPQAPCTLIKGNVRLSYHFAGTQQGLDTTTKNPAPFDVNQQVDISLANAMGEHFTNKVKKAPVAKQAGPTLLGRIGNIFNPSGSSADLLPYAKEARTEALIPSASAPLSGGQDGAYGMQFWMYVQDWNYKYGVEKHVVSRSDPTNPAIMNPSVSLHPTDNTLNISVSVFGSSSSSKTEPAPAGHSGATDDVFLCEVPDIPLQTWCSVSVTLFSRNLDVYLNGKLVKSCVLSGVPKPVAGDIYLNSGGGFSGYLCSFYHYPRMLTPDDASAFYSQGTSCTSATDASLATKTTGYGFKFGVYDAAGKQLSQYVL